MEYNQKDSNKFLYIVLIGDFSKDNPPETHFNSGKNAHEFARKLARSRRKGDYPVVVYKVYRNHYDLDLGYTPRRRYGIVAEWAYSSCGRGRVPKKDKKKKGLGEFFDFFS